MSSPEGTLSEIDQRREDKLYKQDIAREMLKSKEKMMMLQIEVIFGI